MLPGILLGAASLELPPDITIHVAMVVLFIVLSTLLCLWFVYQLLKLNLALYALLLSTALVALLGYVKIVGSANIFVNDACLHLFRGSRNASLDTIMLNVTFLGESPVILYAAVVFIMGLVALKRYITAWHACILMIATFSLNTLLKHLIASPRPWGIYHQLASFSMPSGHATLATTTYMGLALLIASTLRPGRRAPIYMLGLILSFLVGISRLYLNAHWFTDVLAGWMLSALLLIAVTLSYKRYHEKLLSPFIILLLAIIPLSLSFAHDHHKHFKQLSVDYAKINPPITLVHLKTWWQQDNAIPYHRTSLFGFPSHIINIEWVGSFNDIQSTLLKMGWTIPPARDLASIIHRLADISSANYLPMISPQYLDEKPKIVLTRYIVGTHQKKQLLVLRLWDGNARLAENHETLWVGTIGEIPRTYSWLFTVYHPPHTFKLGPELFLPTAQTHPWRWKIIVKPRTINKNTIV
ncbi:MAG: phosphatase, partial [uncultured bacterium]